MKKIRATTWIETVDVVERPYGTGHRKLTREAAFTDSVLSKNKHDILPLNRSQKPAPYGAGTSKTVKGGTGSDDVSERSSVTILEDLELAGVEVTAEDWAEAFSKGCGTSREVQKGEIWNKSETMPVDDSVRLFFAYSETPYSMPAGPMPNRTDTGTAIHVQSRVTGEGANRYCREGDYLFSEKETRILKEICVLYRYIILFINVGDLVELFILGRCPNIEAVLQIVQPGMEGGNAMADVLLGRVTSSGKLIGSWALCYGDYPNSSTSSHNNRDVKTERYEEGICADYCYFDTFDVPVHYGSGYGESYADFAIKVVGIEHFHLGSDCPGIGVKVRVQNTGGRYGDRETVRIYVSCPQETISEECRRLAGFQRTGLLAPGAMEEMAVRLPLSALSSYSGMLLGWMMGSGRYDIFVGSSLESSAFCVSLVLSGTVALGWTMNICPLQEELKELTAPLEAVGERRSHWLNQAGRCPSIRIKDSDVIAGTMEYGTEDSRLSEKAAQFVKTLTLKRYIQLVTGDPGKKQGNNLGSSGISAPDSTTQISSCAMDSNLASIVLIDGLVGPRLNKPYQVEDGTIVPMPFEIALEGGFLCREKKKPTGEAKYQYCAVMPAGALLAQTRDTELLTRVGKAIAREVERFRVTLWLTPRMNIHQNLPCGRSLKYYSEDPLLIGIMAAAVTEGVQGQLGCETTIEHFACNNQGDSRKSFNTVLSKRTLRKVYLKGSGIAIGKSRPTAMVTSYNLTNGIHMANYHDLYTRAARDEQDFQGTAMTDRTTTYDGPDCTASGYIRVGSDIVMLGIPVNHENIRRELEAGTPKEEELRRYVARVAKTIWGSNQYEEAEE